MHRHRRTTGALVGLLALGFTACSRGPSSPASTATTTLPPVPVTQSAPDPARGPGGTRGLHLPTAIPQALDLPGVHATLDLATCKLDVSITDQAIGFGYDSAQIGDEGRHTLVLIATQLALATNVLVVGHTSTEGSNDYNQALSQRRAQVVADVLAATTPTTHFDVVGAGETQPVVFPDDTEAKRAQNRRVTIHAQIDPAACR